MVMISCCPSADPASLSPTAQGVQRPTAPVPPARRGAPGGVDALAPLLATTTVCPRCCHRRLCCPLLGPEVSVKASSVASWYGVPPETGCCGLKPWLGHTKVCRNGCPPSPARPCLLRVRACACVQVCAFGYDSTLGFE